MREPAKTSFKKILGNFFGWSMSYVCHAKRVSLT